MGWSPGLNPPKSSQKTLTINTTVSTSSQDTSQLLGNFSQALSTVKLTVPTKISVKLQVGKCSHLPSIHWKSQNTNARDCGCSLQHRCHTPGKLSPRHTLSDEDIRAWLGRRRHLPRVVSVSEPSHLCPSPHHAGLPKEPALLLKALSLHTSEMHRTHAGTG